MLHDEQAAEHAFKRAVELCDACVKCETNALLQAEVLVTVTGILGGHLVSEAERHRLAASMLDVALQLVRRWQ